ncbi:MAG: hypothetical protein LBS94_02895, partial [Prevotellaceae bacterium]|nr:hypothetical protein [Prevotellaceae bacterium]
MMYRFYASLMLTCIALGASAEKREVQIRKADYMRELKVEGEAGTRLIGSVELMHNNTRMLCDSAYMHPNNRFEAFGHVVVNKDTLWLFGDYMDYEGNTDMGKVRGNLVTLLDGKTRLRTQFLDFNTATNVAYFTQGGTINNGQNLLESERGRYLSNEKFAIFNTRVEMKNEQYNVKSDSLTYHMEQDVATFFKQSYVWNKDVFISFRHGFYSKNDDHFFVADNAYMMSEKQEGWSDSAHYYRAQKESEMFDNVQLYDSSQHAITLGDYAKLYEERGLTYITREPVAALFSDNPKDDTMFIKADTLMAYRVIKNDTVISQPKPPLPADTAIDS